MTKQKKSKGKKDDKSNKQNSGNDPICFDCRFTDDIRKKFKEKREALGLAYSTLAEILEVNWSTVRKWETGKTQYCNIRHRPLIEDFLNGKLDVLFQQFHDEEMSRHAISRNLSPKLVCVLEKIENIYKLCLEYPELCEHLWKGLDGISVSTLKKLLGNDDNDNKDN